MSKSGPEWFNAKRYGLGTGLPCSWQGWLVLIGFLSIIGAASLLLAENNPIAFFAIIAPVTAIFILILAKTTKGGWKWRWGKDKNTW